MTTPKKQNSREHWLAVIAEAEDHPVSMKAYCEERGLSVGHLYAVRGRLRRSPSPASGFTRVHVVERQFEMPDPQWVARFVRHLCGGDR